MVIDHLHIIVGVEQERVPALSRLKLTGRQATLRLLDERLDDLLFHGLTLDAFVSPTDVEGLQPFRIIEATGDSRIEPVLSINHKRRLVDRKEIRELPCAPCDIVV